MCVLGLDDLFVFEDWVGRSVWVLSESSSSHLHCRSLHAVADESRFECWVVESFGEDHAVDETGDFSLAVSCELVFSFGFFG